MAKKKPVKKKNGRPAIELNAEQRIQLEALSAVLNQEQMAEYFGFTQKTFQRMWKRDPELKSLYKKGKTKAIALAGNSLLQNVRKGKEASIFFFLKCQAGWKEARESVDVNLTPLPQIQLCTMPEVDSLPDVIENILDANRKA